MLLPAVEVISDLLIGFGKFQFGAYFELSGMELLLVLLHNVRKWTNITFGCIQFVSGFVGI